MSDMLEVRMRVRADFLDEMRRLLDEPGLKATDLVREALTTYRWAAEQRAKGRIVMSGLENGEALFRLAQPSLEHVPVRAEAPPTQRAAS